MHEVNVVLRKGKAPRRRVDVLGDPMVAGLGESVIWHFTSLEPYADEVKISFNTRGGGKFFKKRRKEPDEHARSVTLNHGRGHTLGIAPEHDDPNRRKGSRSEKYTVEFLKGGKRVGRKDPEVIIGRP